jgi:ribosomal-protein-alanine N-acetyltransferase
MSDHPPAPRILTGRFLLRPVTPDDATERYLDWLRQDDTRRYILSAGQIGSLADLRAYIAEKAQRPDVLFLGIFERQGGEHVGNIKYEPIRSGDGYALMGILIGEPAWRARGVAQEVITASARWLRTNRGISRVILGVERDNELAISAYRKSGFEVEDSEHISSSEREIISMVLHVGPATGVESLSVPLDVRHGVGGIVQHGPAVPVFNPALGYTRFADMVQDVEPYVQASSPSVAGYDGHVVARRVLQRIVEIGLHPLLQLAAGRVQSGLPPFEYGARTLRLGGLVFDLRQNRVSTGAGLWLRSLGSFLAQWIRILWLVTRATLRGAPAARRPATLIFGVGQDDLAQEGSDQRFAEYCERGPLPPLTSSRRLIVESQIALNSSNSDRLSYAKYPLFALLTECGASAGEWLQFVSEHVVTALGYLRSSVTRPLGVILARDLAFHALLAHLNRIGVIEATVITNSHYHVQPLWMRALPDRRFATHMVWYSQNSIPFVYKMDGVRSYLPNHRYIELDHVWVWTQGFARYLHDTAVRGTCHVVGPILWYLPERSRGAGPGATLRIALFDVTPQTPAFTYRVGLVFNYYRAENVIAFVRDIVAARDDLQEEWRRPIEVVLKHKRNPTHVHEQAYLEQIKELNDSGRIRLVPPETNIYSLIAESAVTVVMPYSSPVYVATAMGVPAVFYDPTGDLVPTYEESEGVRFAAGTRQLREVLSELMRAAAGVQPLGPRQGA